MEVIKNPDGTYRIENVEKDEAFALKFQAIHYEKTGGAKHAHSFRRVRKALDPIETDEVPDSYLEGSMDITVDM